MDRIGFFPFLTKKTAIHFEFSRGFCAIGEVVENGITKRKKVEGIVDGAYMQKLKMQKEFSLVRTLQSL